MIVSIPVKVDIYRMDILAQQQEEYLLVAARVEWMWELSSAVPCF